MVFPFSGLPRLICYKALDLADIHMLLYGISVTLQLARMCADPSTYRRKRIVLADQTVSILISSFSRKRYIPSYIDPRRTGVLTWRYKVLIRLLYAYRVSRAVMFTCTAAYTL